MTEEIGGYCTLCRSRCGTLNTVRNGQFVSVRPDPSHPTGKAMCMKGRAAPELVHSPHRQLHPMRRTTPKGSVDPGWVRITWEEALAETAEKLGRVKAESGAEAVAFSVTTPSGTPLSDSIDWIERFIRRFGSPNTCYGTEICNWHKDFAHAFTFGSGLPPADYSNADTILLWGHNPANTWLAQANEISVGRSRGAKLVVVDPRPTALAKQADVWLPVRPGTDGALALGMIRLILDNNLHDEHFLRNWTNAPLLVRQDNGLLLREQVVWPDAVTDRYVAWDGCRNVPAAIDSDRALPADKAQALQLRGDVELIDGDGQRLLCTPALELLARAAAPYCPEYVQSITGVSPDALAAATELMSAGRRIAYHAWTGIGQHTNATQTERAVASLYALSGSYDVVGGNRVRRGPFYRPVNELDALSSEQLSKALGSNERPIGPPATGWVTARDMYRAIIEGTPYRVRALMAFGANLPVSQADSALAEEALKSLEFHVHCDLFETPAARYADIFMPVNTPWEHEGIRFGFEISDDAASLVQFRQRLVEPRGQSRSDNDIVFDLACRLGMSKEFFGGNLEAGWNYMLEPLGLTVTALRAQPEGIKCEVDCRERKYQLPHHDGTDRIRGFDTQTRRVELYSELLHRNGQPPVATFVPPAEDEITRRDGNERRFPLVLSSAKNGYYCHSQHRSLASLRKRAPEPIAEIGQGLAREHGVHEGDWIRISTRNGAARFVARLVPNLADDVVVAEFGWWQACPELDRSILPIRGAESSNANNLISADAVDPVSGSIPHRSFRCNIELDPLTERRQRAWPGYSPFRVVRSTAEADGVRGVVFEAMDGRQLPDFRPGQHIQVRIGDGTSRAYSLTGAAQIDGRTHYSIAVRHQKGVAPDGAVFEGRMSSYINCHMKEGDTVELMAPSGNFVLPRKSQQPLILLAGGVGITPFISLMESLPDGDETEIWLFYGNLNSRTHAFRCRIAEHSQRLPGLRVVNHYDAPLPCEEKGRDFASSARISADVVPQHLLGRQPRIYMCGPPGMMKAFADGLVARGIPPFDIFSEVFRSPPGPIIDDGRQYTVTFSQSHKMPEIWTAAHGPLLQFADKLGLNLPSGCRVGQCESCAVRVVSGTVRHLHGTEPDDPAICLTCQAIPTSDVVLDV
ncbi:molybdopterin-dependent oxidoreductase [Falsochrobactrum sp. TDYN1]|uniref:Molybdopterin-dependent oxidoreductase n=1 Tax=Falsochrobactrum tianjinense TaxID=2706015 RepID=A0A949USD0_9HYPH|nr:molybdopterin-dependent oxidoreductase [Falsochrobactrum sp. TDYN1]